MGKRSTKACGLMGKRTPGGPAPPLPLVPQETVSCWLSASRRPGPPHPLISPLSLFLWSSHGATSQGSSSSLLVVTPLSFPSNGACSCHYFSCHPALNPLTSSYSPPTSHEAVLTWNCQPSGSILSRLVSRGATFQQEESGWGFQPVPLPTAGCSPACTQEPGGVVRAGDGGGRG